MKKTKLKILNSALEEFSKNGFKGARVDMIARQASVNKAMIFYYYNSKQNLFEEVLKNALKEIFIQISKKIVLKPTVENWISKLPQIHVEYFSKNPQIIKMIGLTLMQNPEIVQKFLKKQFKDKSPFTSSFVLKKIKKAYEDGIITESDPLQFIINLISLNIFVFFGKPVIEAVFDLKIDEIEGFYEKRVESIQNIIKKGMLK